MVIVIVKMMMVKMMMMMMHLVLMNAYVVFAVQVVADIVQKRFTFFAMRESLRAHFSFNPTCPSRLPTNINRRDFDLRIIE